MIQFVPRVNQHSWSVYRRTRVITLSVRLWYTQQGSGRRFTLDLEKISKFFSWPSRLNKDLLKKHFSSVSNPASGVPTYHHDQRQHPILSKQEKSWAPAGCLPRERPACVMPAAPSLGLHCLRLWSERSCRRRRWATRPAQARPRSALFPTAVAEREARFRRGPLPLLQRLLPPLRWRHRHLSRRTGALQFLLPELTRFRSAARPPTLWVFLLCYRTG